jgi:hypothetical protein
MLTRDRATCLAALDRLRDVWVKMGRTSDEMLATMSREGRARLEREGVA